jgi:O-antigen/teichoic acid export membrane protein
MLKALHRPIWGGFFEAAAWPLLTLALFGPTLYTGSGSTTQAALAFLLAALLASGWAWGMVYRMLPRGDRCRPLPARRLLDSCVPLTLVEIANFALLWAPFILLPILTDSAEAGRYNLAHRFAAQLGLIMLVVAAITAPRFAAHFARDEAGELRRLVGRSTRVLILLGAPAGALLLAWGETLLGWFGDDFVDANHALQMLVLGQLINLATGPAGYLLAMTGHERALRNTLLVTLALMLPSAWMLITAFGANGAAAAVAGAMLFQNLICNRLVVKRLGLPFFLVFAR